MRTLRLGDRGLDVMRWQTFLVGQGFEPGPADGIFGPATMQATVQFQEKYGLAADGIAGNRTLGQAQVLGLDVIPDTAREDDETGAGWPPRPAGLIPLISNEDRARVFGRFAYVGVPQPGNREAIRVTDGWEAENIVRIELPQLAGVQGAGATGALRCHRLVADQTRALWQAWEDAGLLGLVQSWAGMYTARFIRGSSSVLSNHAFGSAFDINAGWNPLGARPALLGRPGSVRKLVPIALTHGFFWGGHFPSRPDGMHFEVARVLG